MNLTDFDRKLLQQLGGVDKNSFVHISDPYPDETEKNEEPLIINHSSYYDYKELISLMKKHKNQFSIFSSNIQSIRAKFDQLMIFIEMLRKENLEFSAICLQESWLNEGADTSGIHIKGYNLIPQGYSCSSKGGLIIYLHERYKHVNKMKLNMFNTWEGQVIQVNKGKTLSKSVILGNIYRPPKDSIEHYNEFITEFSPILQQLSRANCDIALAGDFNINLLKLNSTPTIGEYFDMFTNCSFFPKITMPTRLSIKHGTLIDNIFCKLTENTHNTPSGILMKKFSDHQPYFTFLDNSVQNNTAPKVITITQNDPLSTQKFIDELKNNAKILNMNQNPDQDPNINYNILSDIIQEAKNKYMPTKQVRYNKYKHKKCNWMTMDIIHLIEKKDNVYKIHKLTDPDAAEYHLQSLELKSLITQIKKAIRNAKKLYYDNLFENFKNDIKATWRTIGEILSRTKKKKSFPSLFKDEKNNIITDKTLIANKFNSFFASIGSDLAKKIKVSGNKSFKNFLTKKHNCIFGFTTVDESIIGEIMDELKPKTSSGFDGLSSKLLKTMKEVIITPITLIVNQMLKSGTFPDKLKISKINPIYKKDDETLFTNYRPISLLPAISKIFEKVMFKQIYSFFQEKKLFYIAQYGFRKGHSTEHAAIELIDRITLSMDKGDIPIGIFLDLSKAFDTLDHEILLEKLKYYGFDDNALKLMRSYLCDRTQYVEIDNTESDYLTVKTGVPQGSILGPLLFIIYMNDIINASNLFYFVIYADDTSLTSTLEIFRNTGSLSNINHELSKISEWLKLNKLSINLTKTKYMIFHTINKRIPNLEIKIDDTIIERVPDFNFLGITLNEHLNWKSHMDKIAAKLSRNIGILNNLKHYLPLTTKLTIYNSLILSHINYGLLIWGFNNGRIYKLQKRAVRVLTASKYNAHTEPIFKQLKLLKIEDILKLQELKFYYKFKHNLLPHYLQNIPSNYNFEVHEHNTRIQNDMHVGRVTHEYAKRCIRYDLPLLINNTSQDIISKIRTHSLDGYAWYIKQYYLSSYKDSCTIQACYICARD